MSVLSASDVSLEDISQLVGHVSTSVTEAVYRHEIRPALTKGAAAMAKIFNKKRTSKLFHPVCCRPARQGSGPGRVG